MNAAVLRERTHGKHLPMDQDLIKRIVEAALLAAAQPLSVAQLSGLFPEEEPVPPGSIEQALNALGAESAQRGVELVEVASGFRFQVRAEVQPWVSRLWTERQTKYSRALLETLALIAYRQPITRGEIEQIRGVAVSSNIIRTLEEREWARVVGHRDVPGKPALYGTTRSFLDYFGLKSLDQLPPLAELREIPDLEPQLQLEPVHSDGTVAALSIDRDTGFDAATGDAGHIDAELTEGIDADSIDTDVIDTDPIVAEAIESDVASTHLTDVDDSDVTDTDATDTDDGAGDDGSDPSTDGPTATVRPEHTA